MFAGTDLTNADIDGFRLGQTLEEVKTLHPKMRIKEIKPDGDMIMGYLSSVNGVALSFASDKFGKVLFSIQKVVMYREKPNVEVVYGPILKKYGTPDYGGRQMLHVASCWGKCFGNHTSLEFKLKVMSMGKGGYPMSLTLVDKELQTKNRRMFLDNRTK